MVTFNYTEEFYRQLKHLAKHYRSLADDLDTLQHELMENPEIGVSLGGGKRKIRLGVKSTADIAGLLFLSNQTIYNCRSVTKNKALNKDTFDEDVMKICTIIQQ